jgi:MoaA/NifB/PqqE/SkfB family radical SAM enzyme
MSEIHKWLVGSRIAEFDASAKYCIDHDLFFRSKPMPDGDPTPLSVTIRLGSECNLSCGVCLSEERPFESTLSSSAVVHLIDLLSPFLPLRIVWTGGEPTLVPFLREALGAAIDKGFANVVTSNMTIGDPLRDLRGEFTYNISVYGNNRDAYRRHTGRDLFDVFARNLQDIIETRHRVALNVRVERNWQAYLPQTISWIRHLPICKLLLTNTRRTGRIGDSVWPPNSSEMAELERYLRSQVLEFPVVYPSATSDALLPTGLIVISGHPHKLACVNGMPQEDGDALRDILRKLSASNRRLFLLENYI